MSNNGMVTHERFSGSRSLGSYLLCANERLHHHSKLCWQYRVDLQNIIIHRKAYVNKDPRSAKV